MAELMAEGADAIDSTGSVELTGTGVGIDFDTIDGLCFIGFRQIIHVGPDGATTATVGLPLASIDNEHLVDLTIIVPVVILKIQGCIGIVVGCSHSLDYQLVGMLVVTFTTTVLTIVGIVLISGIRSHDVECQFKLRYAVSSNALSLEVVGDGTLEATNVIVLRVQDILIFGKIVGCFEFRVREFHQNDQTFLLACQMLLPLAYGCPAADTLGTLVLKCLTASLSLGNHLLYINRLIVVGVGHFLIRRTIGS